MKGGQTQGHMMTERSFMKEDGRLSGLKLLMPFGKKNMKNGQRGLPRSFPNGLVRDQVKRLVSLNLLRKKKEVKLLQRMRKKRRRKRKKMNKEIVHFKRHDFPLTTTYIPQH